MAVVNFSGAIKSYVGTSSDKTALTGMVTGSRFFCVTDGCWYVYTGAAWVKEIRPAS